MNVDNEFRKAEAAELRLFQRLLSTEFPGCKEISQQLGTCLVRIIYEEGSFEIKPNPLAPAALVEKTVPVEAQAKDEDGIRVHFLLFVRNGYVNELEIYKDDGSVIKRLPSPDDLEIIVLPA